jgi:hypothetical protein
MASLEQLPRKSLEIAVLIPVNDESQGNRIPFDEPPRWIHTGNTPGSLPGAPLQYEEDALDVRAVDESMLITLEQLGDPRLYTLVIMPTNWPRKLWKSKNRPSLSGARSAQIRRGAVGPRDWSLFAS